MGIRNLCNSRRFFTIPHFFTKTPFLTKPFSSIHFHSPNSLLFSIGSSPFCFFKNPFDGSNIYFNLGFQFHTSRYFCSYPYSSYKNKPYATSKQVSEIIALIIEGVNDLEYRLNMLNVSLSMASVIYIFDKLASERVSALMFFHWLNVSHPELCCDPDIGGCVVDNCGLLGNFEAMVPIFNEFNLKRMCLGRRAFRFLVILRFDEDSRMECVRRIVNVLNEVGGVCQSSGFKVLIEILSFSGNFDTVEFVIGEAGRHVNRYNYLLRMMCKRGDYEKVGDLVEKMKRCGVEPNGSTYNMLVSCLFKIGNFAEACQVLETMEKENGLSYDFTFDTIVRLLCKHGQIDLALTFTDKMTLKGIEPCSLTHAAVIKCYFEQGKYDEAHKYVVDSACKGSYSSNENYTLLASLHLKKGSVLHSQKILHEMMDRGLKPNYSVYMKIRKCLEKKNKADMSWELSRKYLSLIET
ncbi:pentatricopeptide repeat-containing protein At3g56030, mitochondrial-like [Trifolium pratense]|uniref:pentatricopeptide repeat-containing protein At3g56030, mitochondrial-like n=1 Tax=Trifolium pratense TaxID=57577 RepID=UPI001E694A0B|nr:pentatricopeptide repeat-containing protein At3g56030, mitochondrial-like [Trifolium pratense]